MCLAKVELNTITLILKITPSNFVEFYGHIQRYRGLSVSVEVNWSIRSRSRSIGLGQGQFGRGRSVSVEGGTSSLGGKEEK